MIRKPNAIALPQTWEVSGLTRSNARRIPRIDDRPIYGGTPSDASVIEAIRELNGRGLAVTLYPFILMDQLGGNGMPDPWGNGEQAALPWRGRITTAKAPGLPGSTDRSALAADEVAQFFGSTAPAALVPAGQGVTGPTDDWGYRRFVLHYAKLCALAGGVEAFCIGSEMAALTTLRGQGDTFPAVDALRRLARDVRAILPGAKIGYAADWSEYAGYRPGDTGNLHFHLDPLWGDPAIDFVGIDNYMPLADWRDGRDHLDGHRRSTYDSAYLLDNVEGGEGYDWYYQSPAARIDQIREPITDGAYGEPWVFRYKDLRGWWGNTHHDRLEGVRAPQPTDWVPFSKPIRFVEYGCAAIDKGANQPNKFIDAKSSESSLPYHSNGQRDDTMQIQYLRSFLSYWSDPARNPAGENGNRMVDLDHSFAWAWDTRPWPYFPQLTEFWSDGTNYGRGHWITGRITNQPLATVIKELCRSAGLTEVDTTGVHGIVRGYSIADIQTARADLQPLLMAHGVEASEQEGILAFSMRENAIASVVSSDRLVRTDSDVIRRQRGPKAEAAGSVLIHHLDHDADFAPSVVQATMPGTGSLPLTETELPLSLTRGEGRALAERFLSEAQIVRDTIDFHIPPSRGDLRAGDLFRLDAETDIWRVDRLDQTGSRHVRAVRTDPAIYEPSDDSEADVPRMRPTAPLPVDMTFLELPLLRGDENPYAPYVPLSGHPWPGSVAIHTSVDDSSYRLNTGAEEASQVGKAVSEMAAAMPGVWDDGPPLLVRFGRAKLSSATGAALLAGGNAAAIGDGDGRGWEVFQFGEARPVGGGVWALSRRLRGQRGTEWAMRSPWPVGSKVVLLDDTLIQVDVGPEALGLLRHYRIGPARLPLSDTSYRYAAHTTTGEALKPYAPVHLRLIVDGVGRRVAWIRRSRMVQEGWDVADVPLGEAREAYLVRLATRDGRTLWEGSSSVPEIGLAGSELAAFGAELTGARILVAQVSDEIGPGHWASILFA